MLIPKMNFLFGFIHFFSFKRRVSQRARQTVGGTQTDCIELSQATVTHLCLLWQRSLLIMFGRILSQMDHTALCLWPIDKES